MSAKNNTRHENANFLLASMFAVARFDGTVNDKAPGIFSMPGAFMSVWVNYSILNAKLFNFRRFSSPVVPGILAFIISK